jgi:hypothetical protein
MHFYQLFGAHDVELLLLQGKKRMSSIGEITEKHRV